MKAKKQRTICRGEIMAEKKKGGGALLGAAFLMATSAIGPGFLTQTATFTGSLGSSFGFVILSSILLAAIAQMNIWRVLCTTGLRGQDVANKVLPGLGFLVAFVRCTRLKNQKCGLIIKIFDKICGCYLTVIGNILVCYAIPEAKAEERKRRKIKSL